MLVTPSGITMSVKRVSFSIRLVAFQSGLEYSSLNSILHQAFKSVIYTVLSFIQFSNAPEPILVTFLPIITL